MGEFSHDILYATKFNSSFNLSNQFRKFASVVEIKVREISTMYKLSKKSVGLVNRMQKESFKN